MSFQEKFILPLFKKNKKNVDVNMRGGWVLFGKDDERWRRGGGGGHKINNFMIT